MSDIDFNMLFQLFLIAGIVFLGISVLLFFRYDVRGILNAKTGRGAKRAIKQMEELNAQTGKLRSDMIGNTPSILDPEERISPPETAARSRPATGSATGSAAGTATGSGAQPSYTGGYQTFTSPNGTQGSQPRGTASQGSQETELLNEVQETSLLYGGLEPTPSGGAENETQLLYNGLEQSAMPQRAGVMPGETEPMSMAQRNRQTMPAGKFVITKDIMLIHTDEVV